MNELLERMRDAYASEHAREYLAGELPPNYPVPAIVHCTIVGETAWTSGYGRSWVGVTLWQANHAEALEQWSHIEGDEYGTHWKRQH